MKKQEYLEQLAHFVSGATSIEELQEYVEDVLSDLRENRRPSAEKVALSRMELVLHEVREDAREPFAAYALALTMLQRGLKDSRPPEGGYSRTSHEVAWFSPSTRGMPQFGLETESDEPTRCHLTLVETKA